MAMLIITMSDISKAGELQEFGRIISVSRLKKTVIMTAPIQQTDLIGNHPAVINITCLVSSPSR